MVYTTQRAETCMFSNLYPSHLGVNDYTLGRQSCHDNGAIVPLYSHIIFSAIYYIIILLSSSLLLFYFHFCRLTVRLDRFPLGLNQYDCTNVPDIRQRYIIISHLVHTCTSTPSPTTKHKDGVVVTCLNCIYSIAAL